MKHTQKTWQGSSTKRHNTAFFLFVFLGMLTAFGPFVTDMYLPSLPAMTSYFNTSASMVQLGLTFSMLGLAVGQILFGPLSDKFGRRQPLLVSMWLFLGSTLACIFSPNIEVFIALRFIQGIAGAGGIVISRSIATDKFKGANLAKALAVIGAINGIAPVAAPVMGGAVLKVTGWRGVFAILFVLGAALTAACIHFNESLSRSKRSREKLSHTLSLFKNVLKNANICFAFCKWHLPRPFYLAIFRLRPLSFNSITASLLLLSVYFLRLILPPLWQGPGFALNSNAWKPAF